MTPPRRLAMSLPFILPAAAGAAAAAERRETWRDAARDRDVPVLLRLPAGEAPAPLVLVSHGLGGSREGMAFLGQAMAAAGFIAVHLQHLGSDSAIWRGASDPVSGMRNAGRDPLVAANRLLDVPFALDEAQRRLGARIDPARIAIAGHSFGSWTAQHALGQALPLSLPRIPDARLRAGILLSPVLGFFGPPAANAIRVPLLHITGTEDRTLLDRAGPEERLAIFEAIAGTPQAAAIFAGAGHLAFAGREEAGAGHVAPTFHARTAALAVLFLRAALLADAEAAAEIGRGASALLQPGDRLTTKDWVG
ncbi:alpha/beta hydrolase family protein [Sabulicella glaciei]|uniref:Acetylhydrolase n=1 Tax=Sabulicella glaciei TaxID=2984948 RepID=A0ABT3NX08_9PROT|nr:acetylhydrolase [Roseococcus sp. MDT2-1-1]MCW8086695.1 acetylhydrolase [Roseococcus sp. MDT2-1-1]